jgi:hypothetical protein
MRSYSARAQARRVLERPRAHAAVALRGAQIELVDERVAPAELEAVAEREHVVAHQA